MKPFYHVVLIGGIAAVVTFSALQERRGPSRSGSDESFVKFMDSFKRKGERLRLWVEDLRVEAGARREHAHLTTDDFRARFFRNELIEQARKTAEMMHAAYLEAERWEKEVLPLFKSERGALLTRREALVEEFDRLYSLDRQSRELAYAEWQTCEQLYQELKKGSYGETSTLWSDSQNLPFKEWQTRANSIRGAYEPARIRVERMLEEAAALPAGPKITLADAIYASRRKELLEKASQLAMAGKQSAPQPAVLGLQRWRYVCL